MLLDNPIRGPKRSIIVWKIPAAHFSKIGIEKIIPSASSILSNNHWKSSFNTHMLPLPENRLITHALQPVQCLISRSIKRTNSISAPCSFAASNASLHIQSLAPFLVPPEIPKIFMLFFSLKKNVLICPKLCYTVSQIQETCV